VSGSQSVGRTLFLLLAVCHTNVFYMPSFESLITVFWLNRRFRPELSECLQNYPTTPKIYRPIIRLSVMYSKTA
jgi:hypothetical protein